MALRFLLSVGGASASCENRHARALSLRDGEHRGQRSTWQRSCEYLQLEELEHGFREVIHAFRECLGTCLEYGRWQSSCWEVLDVVLLSCRSPFQIRVLPNSQVVPYFPEYLWRYTIRPARSEFQLVDPVLVDVRSRSHLCAGTNANSRSEAGRRVGGGSQRRFADIVVGHTRSLGRKRGARDDVRAMSAYPTPTL